jgi:hypothetical protein
MPVTLEQLVKVRSPLAKGLMIYGQSLIDLVNKSEGVRQCCLLAV